MIGKRVLIHLNLFIRRLNIRSLKRRPPNQQRIQYHPYTPHINLIRMAGPRAEHLGSYVVGSSTDRSLPLPIKHHLSRKPKIPDLHLHLFIQKQVSQLKIPVDHLLLMHVFCSLNNLRNIALSLNIRQSLTSFHHFVQR